MAMVDEEVDAIVANVPLDMRASICTVPLAREASLGILIPRLTPVLVPFQ